MTHWGRGELFGGKAKEVGAVDVLIVEDTFVVKTNGSWIELNLRLGRGTLATAYWTLWALAATAAPLWALAATAAALWALTTLGALLALAALGALIALAALGLTLLGGCYFLIELLLLGLELL